MSIIRTNAFQSVTGVGYQVPVNFQRFSTTTYTASSTVNTWNTYWSWTYTPRFVGSRLYVYGNLNLLNETSGKTQNLRFLQDDTTEVYRHNSIQECAFSGWYAQGCPIFAQLPEITLLNPMNFKLQIYHNSGTAYLNYPFTGLGNPSSELIFMEVKP